MQLHEQRVLALDPASRGCGFAVLEGPDRLIDWGVSGGDYRDERQLLRVVGRLIDKYAPDVVVLEDWTAPSCRRLDRARRMIRAISGLALERRVAVRMFSRDHVRAVFGGETPATKYSIATALATRFPELALRLPPPRRLWMSEDYRMGIFDAVALAVTFYTTAAHVGHKVK
jgi:Holliday junction resolvasome RuvABC endonuclease subunit